MHAARQAIVISTAVLVGGLSMPQASSAPPAQIAVSPSRFEIEIGAMPTSHSLDVLNLSDGDVRVNVTVATWDIDEDGSVRIVEPDDQSLDQWMRINPLRFTIPAKGSQTVRFVIRPKLLPVEGEHRAMIYLNQEFPEDSERDLRVKFSLGVAVYGFAGEVRRVGMLNSVTIDQDGHRALFDISSTGTAHVRMSGQFAVYRVDQYPGILHTAAIEDLGGEATSLPGGMLVTGFLPSRPVLPGTRRRIALTLPLKLAPGDYILDLNGGLPGDVIDTAVPFTVPEPGEGEIAAGDGGERETAPASLRKGSDKPDGN